MLGVVIVVLAMGLAACVGDPDPTNGNDPIDGAFALTNTTSYAPDGLLRGQGLKVYTEMRSDLLEPNSVYDVEVANDDRDEVMLTAQLRTSERSTIAPYAVMFDVGQYDDASPGEHIRVTLTSTVGDRLEQIIDLSDLRLPGWNVTEVEAPEIVVCDASGTYANAFAVGGQDPGETVGPVHIVGRGLPEGLAGSTVDVYVVEARDNWMYELIPQAGEEGHVLGPIAVQVDRNGNIPVTALDFGAAGAGTDYETLRSLVGIYDVLVDTNDNREMDWEVGVKDGGDGMDEQVGFTIQYSQAWIRARGERHILVNIAFDDASRDGGAWRNEYRAGSHLYTYLNPPVMHQFHFSVDKWIVNHQDFETFWNNPDMETGPNGCIPFESYAITGMGVPVQRGCTNTGPVDHGPMAMNLGNPDNTYDVVFDRNGDGCYMPGEDLLDVVGGAGTEGGLVSFSDFEGLDRADQVGFRVIE
jgi:hypothetical protein